jgi:hypothetical protein
MNWFKNKNNNENSNDSNPPENKGPFCSVCQDNIGSGHSLKLHMDREHNDPDANLRIR